MRKLNIIVGVDETGGFGKDGKIPWFYPADLKHFQKVTNGSSCVMGRHTYTDINDMRKAKGPIKQSLSVLHGRDCYVLSSVLKDLPDATVADSLRYVCDHADINKPIFVIGGAKLFIEALAFTDRVYMTIIPINANCDRHFPINVLNRWFDIESGEESDGLQYMVYRRKPNH